MTEFPTASRERNHRSLGGETPCVHDALGNLGRDESSHGAARFDIRIAADGKWYHEGVEIRRPALVKLFSTVMIRDDNGDYWLATPAEKGRITVDDAPFVVVGLDRLSDDGMQVLRFQTNLDEVVDLGPDHPLRMAFDLETGEPRPYLVVRPRLEGLINRAVYYQLVEWAEEWEGRVGVWSKGEFFPLDQEPMSGRERQD